MKKITLSLLFLLAIVFEGYGQVTVGEGTNVTQVTPFNAGYGFTYSQSIYLASEINTSGLITSIQWYYNGSGALPNSQNLTIYLGHTAKEEFNTTTDFVAISDLTAVYTGGFVTGSTAGWKTITFTTPFAYDGNSNLVVATDENMPGSDSSADKFRNSAVSGNRSIFGYAVAVDLNPVNPESGSATRGVVPFVPNIVFGGITQDCPNPTALYTSNLTANQVTATWSAVPGQSEWEVYVVEQGSSVPTAETIGVPVFDIPSFVKSGLISNTVYSVYVRAVCSETSQSAWVGPTNFTTLCDPFGDFNENFDSTISGTGIVPNCWTKTVISTNVNADINIISNIVASAPNAVYMTNSTDTAAQIYMSTPALTAIGANTHRLKFKARGGVNGQLLSVGTISDPSDPSTYTELESISLTNAYFTYSVTFTTSTSANYIAFKHGLGGTARKIYLDDIVWEPIPTTPPACIQELNVVINEGCGNLPTLFSWPAVSGADGYTISIGTTANGTGLIVDNVDLFTALNYSFVGNPGTNYYYTITPYNAFGPATACVEGSFATYDDGCYCASVPTSNGGAGILSVQINGEITSVTDVTYANFTENEAINITQGLSTMMEVTFGTGSGYFTHIWIDFNDNFTFETSELVYTGESESTNPSVLNTSFVVPLSAALGQHRMRIGTTDYIQSQINPCYNSFAGVTLDFLINVEEAPDCLPPTVSTTSSITGNSATMTWVSEGTLFNLELVNANEAQGSGILTEGIVGNTISLTNLDPQTNYSYYLQTDCGDDSLSVWSGPFSFSTGCAALGDFTEDFTTDTNISAPACWNTIVASTNTIANVLVSASFDYVIMRNSGDALAALYLITPSLVDLPLNTHRIKFKSLGTEGTSLIVGTMTDPASQSTFTAVETIPLTETFTDYAVSFLNSTTDSHVAFKFVGTSAYQTVNLDDVVWETIPACPDVLAVAFDSATPTSATISWTPGADETAWQYAYGPETETDPSLLIPIDVTGTSPLVTISGLDPSTSYKVWIRASCGTLFGNWSPALPFLTGCLPVTSLPWEEGFENLTNLGNNLFPVCWSKENGDWSTSNATIYNLPKTGANYLRCGYTSVNEYMWTPGFELTAGESYDFSFNMAGDGYYGWTVDVYQNTTQNSTSATQLGTTTTASGTGIYTIQPYVLVQNTFVPTTSGVYYFALKVNQPNYPTFISFDDFRMELTPTCFPPLAPTVSNETETTATLNWIESTPVPANGYDYFVTSNLELIPNAATEPTGTVEAGVTTVNLIDLTGSTFYKTYVKSNCATDVKSIWSEAGVLNTTCVTAVLPYSINFESAVLPNMPLCTLTQNVGSGNNWETVNNPGSGFTNNALRYTFNTTNAANTWFFTNTLYLVAGTQYTLSYLYGSSSTSYTEKLKVAYGSSADAGSMTNILANNSSINGGAAQDNLITFTPTTSGQYVIGFNAYSDANQSSLYLDNILIQQNLGAADFENNSFSAYPNPVKDILNVSFTQNISDVSVYNLLGQEVLLTNMNANKGQVDMSSLTSGTYLVKVNTENGVKTIKVIKE